jgi:hypothetical protein
MLKLDEMNIEVFNHLNYKDYMAMCGSNRSISKLCKESTVLKTKLRKSIKKADNVMNTLKYKTFVVLQPRSDDFIFNDDYLFKSPFIIELININAHHFTGDHIDISFTYINDQGFSRRAFIYVTKEELYKFLIALFFDQIILSF